MITVKIGNEEQSLEGASPGWITQQIERRRRDGISVCVVVRIRTADLSIHLATPGCAGNAGGGRPPTANERVILELWRKHGLNEAGFAPGDMVAFLAQLRHLL
jgi:hypothetical protein